MFKKQHFFCAIVKSQTECLELDIFHLITDLTHASKNFDTSDHFFDSISDDFVKSVFKLKVVC